MFNEDGADGAGGRRTASRLGVRAPVFTSSLCLPLTQCCAGRYSNIDVADTKRIPLRITCRTVSFGVYTGLRYFSLRMDPLPSLSVLWHVAFSQGGDCSECSPIARLCF